MSRRIITTENLEEDVKIESHLRPQLLDDYIGQEKAKEIVAVTLDSIADALTAGDKVQFVGFGSFEVRERAGRTGRNPQDGSEIYIEPSKNVKFKAGKELKDKVNA